MGARGRGGERAAHRAAGHPTALTDYAQPAIPDEENAAELLQKATVVLNDPNGSVQALRLIREAPASHALTGSSRSLPR